MKSPVSSPGVHVPDFLALIQSCQREVNYCIIRFLKYHMFPYLVTLIINSGLVIETSYLHEDASFVLKQKTSTSLLSASNFDYSLLGSVLPESIVRPDSSLSGTQNLVPKNHLAIANDTKDRIAPL